MLVVRSARSSKAHRTLIPPYVGLGFDHALRGEPDIFQINHGTIESMGWLIKHGRPLFVFYN